MRVDLFLPLLLLPIGLFAGSCRNLSGASDNANQEKPETTCQERVARAQQEVESVRLANVECNEPGDCVLFDPSTQCRGDCPKAVSETGLEAVEETVARVNETVCREYATDGCPVATPGCAAVAATCQDGACVSESAN